VSILVGRDTRLVVQGITGREGGFQTERCLEYGTKVVAGCTPGRGGETAFGVPVFNTVVRIVGEDGEALAPGEIGEFVTSGPQVVPGYWEKPEETEHALPGGALRTGDVGFMDADGWFYLVDRKKDQINASGYKVWPREVEDVLYGHEAVREAAVVGVPDEYRGETVKAFVSLKRVGPPTSRS
jgi:long-chain acyl-CoA synthetase